MKLTLMEGNEAIGWGAMAAGCRFFAGYPITPATTVFNTMLELLPRLSCTERAYPKRSAMAGRFVGMWKWSVFLYKTFTTK